MAALITLWLLWMTLRPNPEVAANLESLTAPAAGYGISAFWLIDIAGNIAVFAPLGAAVALALETKRIRYGTLAGFTLSVTIELLQGFLTTRVSSWEDVALNTLGAGMGAAAAGWFIRYRRRARCGWAKAFRKMAAAADDELLLDQDVPLSSFDIEEWQW